MVQPSIASIPKAVDYEVPVGDATIRWLDDGPTNFNAVAPREFDATATFVAVHIFLGLLQAEYLDVLGSC